MQQGHPSPAGAGQFIHSPQSVPSPASVPMRMGAGAASMGAPSPAMPSAANTPSEQPGSVEDQQGGNPVQCVCLCLQSGIYEMEQW